VGNFSILSPLERVGVRGIAKNLRNRVTDAEKLLWRYLRAKQLEGFKFRRQQPIGNYMVDFVCFEKGIVIEADGGQHAVEREKFTKWRTEFSGNFRRTLHMM
jgi:very-short-patch-repair endonuclease